MYYYTDTHTVFREILEFPQRSRRQHCLMIDLKFANLQCIFLLELKTVQLNAGSRGSSGSIVSDYGLDDQAIEVRSPTEADFSSSPCVQTGSGAYPAS
jgi:hypothetical protein